MLAVTQRYEVTAKPEKVEWASQNMLVLGIIIVLGLLLHLFNFWYNMMFAELLGTSFGHSPADGFAFIQDTFANPVFVVLYLIWLVALWFHLTHGFWSAIQTLGWSGKNLVLPLEDDWYDLLYHPASPLHRSCIGIRFRLRSIFVLRIIRVII